MKNKITIKMIFLLFSIILISCSKDENNDPIVQANSEIHTSEIVTITLENKILSQNEYQGTISGIPVKLIKTGDNTLAFYVPDEIASGANDLVISSLSNATFHYNINKTTLSGTADENLVDLFAKMNSFEQILDNSPEGISAKKGINTLKNYYDNASDEKKISIAILYKANKEMFNTIFSVNLIEKTAKISLVKDDIVSETRLYINKHKVAVALLGVGALFIATGNPVGVVVGVGILGVSAYKAYKANSDAVDNIYNKISLEVSGWFSNTNKQLATNIELTDDIEKELSFNVNARKIIATDVSKTDLLAKEYFSSFNLYNHYVEDNNPRILEVNSTEKTDYDLLNKTVLPTSSPTVLNPVNANIFQNIKLTLSNSSVTIVSSSLSKEGFLKLKVKVNGSISTWPVATNLNISYSDGFSSFNGQIPIKIQHSLIGTWSMITYNNGIPKGQFIDHAGYSLCPSLITTANTINSNVLTITSNNINDVIVDINKNYNKNYTSECVLISDLPDTSETYTNSINYSYTISGTTLNLKDVNDPSYTESLKFNFIDQNTLSIGGSVYIRQ